MQQTTQIRTCTQSSQQHLFIANRIDLDAILMVFPWIVFVCYIMCRFFSLSCCFPRNAVLFPIVHLQFKSCVIESGVDGQLFIASICLIDFSSLFLVLVWATCSTAEHTTLVSRLEFYMRTVVHVRVLSRPGYGCNCNDVDYLTIASNSLYLYVHVW